MRTISVILPAARDADRTQRVVDAFHAANPAVHVDFVVSSPSFIIERAVNIRDNYSGVFKAFVLALPFTKGDYVAWISDEALPTPNCLANMADFLDADPPPFIAEFFVGDEGPKQFGLRYARWGMMSRESISRIGFFDEEYQNYFADVDLGIRCWQMGGSVESCGQASIYITQLNDELSRSHVGKSWKHDYLRFRKTWRTKFLWQWPDEPEGSPMWEALRDERI